MHTVTSNKIEPWAIHRDTLESLDPLYRMVAESYIQRGIWRVIADD